MSTTSLTEAESQALIVLVELAHPVTTENNNSYAFFPQTEAEARRYFGSLAEDLGTAYEHLAARGLAQPRDSGWALTETGRALAEEIRALRPPIWYWYRAFYRAIEHSAAFGAYCTQAFGLDLGQHGFSDLGELNQALALAPAGGGIKWLDLGCGNGKIAEYISDHTGARVLGIDYVPEAIAAAQRRTAAKRDRLRYQVGHLDALDLGGERFDVILSIDSIFFGRSLEETLARLRGLLRSTGCLLILCANDLAAPLDRLGMAYSRRDLSASHHAHMLRKRQAAEALQAAFEAEGNRFIWENLMQESGAGEGDLPPRWLYHVTPA